MCGVVVEWKVRRWSKTGILTVVAATATDGRSRSLVIHCRVCEGPFVCQSLSGAIAKRRL
jgi:hypothetical protein